MGDKRRGDEAISDCTHVRCTAETSNYTNNEPRNYTVQFDDEGGIEEEGLSRFERVCLSVCLHVSVCICVCVNARVTKDSIPLGCIPPAWISYMLQFQLSPPDVTGGIGPK